MTRWDPPLTLVEGRVARFTPANTQITLKLTDEERSQTQLVQSIYINN